MATELEMIQGKITQHHINWIGYNNELLRLDKERKQIELAMEYQEERMEALNTEMEVLLEQENPGSSTRRVTKSYSIVE